MSHLLPRLSMLLLFFLMAIYSSGQEKKPQYKFLPRNNVVNKSMDKEIFVFIDLVQYVSCFHLPALGFPVHMSIL